MIGEIPVFALSGPLAMAGRGVAFPFTDAHSVENVIQYFQSLARRRVREWLDFRNQERHQFHKRLERNGQNL